MFANHEFGYIALIKQFGSWSSSFHRRQIIHIYTDFKRGYRNVIKVYIFTFSQYIFAKDCLTDDDNLLLGKIVF